MLASELRPEAEKHVFDHSNCGSKLIRVSGFGGAKKTRLLPGAEESRGDSIMKSLLAGDFKLELQRSNAKNW